MGTDAGNPLTLHGPSVYAEMEAMQAAGMAPMEVLVAATANGARAMGRRTTSAPSRPARSPTCWCWPPTRPPTSPPSGG